MGRGERRVDGFPARILLATDGSECAALATRAALDLASRAGSELHVVHVWLDIHTSHFHAYVRRELHREGQEILDGQVGEIEASGDAVAGAHLREGHSVGEILTLADELDAGLIVVGSRGMGSIQRMLLGSVSEGLANRTTRPLLVVRGPWPPARVVIGDDYSEGAREASDLAARVGALLGAEVTLARVYPQARGTAPEEADASLEERAAELRGVLGRELPVERLAGDPAASILEMAERSGESVLISVGSRGGGVVDRLRLGSVSTRILRAGKGPVLISPRPSDGQVPGRDAGVQPRFLVAGGSEGSLHAAERAVDFSRMAGARLIVLTILQDPARSGGEGAGRIAQLAAKYGVDHDELTATGDPVGAILDAARQLRVDYVLLDAEGLTTPGGILQEVLKRADRPVLLIGGRARTQDPVLPGHEAAPGETAG